MILFTNYLFQWKKTKFKFSSEVTKLCVCIRLCIYRMNNIECVKSFVGDVQIGTTEDIFSAFTLPN